MSQEVYVGVDLAKEFHQVMAVGPDHQVLAPTFRIGRGRGGVQEMIKRLRFLVRRESGLGVGRLWLHDLSGAPKNGP